MPRQKNQESPKDAKVAGTYIGEGAFLQSEKLSGAETVRIDGHYVGKIDLDGYLQIGEPGRIEGDMQVDFVLVAGVVIGNILCRQTVHLAPTAKVLGNIAACKIIIDDGAIYHGIIKTRDEVATSGVAAGGTGGGGA